MSRDDFFSVMHALFNQKELLEKQNVSEMTVPCPICGKKRRISLDKAGNFSSVCENRDCVRL